MSTLNKTAYKQLLEENIEWLLKQERTLERDHIEVVLKWEITQLDRRAGWRLFACEECGRIVWKATRDRFSPSSESCKCGEIVYPLDEKPDENLKVDKFCNLIEYPEDAELREGDSLWSC